MPRLMPVALILAGTVLLVPALDRDRLRALRASFRRFSHWLVDGQRLEGAQLAVHLNQDRLVEAVFRSRVADGAESKLDGAAARDELR